MTNEQKNEIIKYRRAGYGYKKISRLLSLCESTVKSFCRRNRFGGNATANTAVQVCRNCGAAICQTPGKRKKLFCSDSCRNRWWRNHPDLVNRKAVYEFVCPACGKTFTAYGNANRKYCCHECYIKDRFGGHRHEQG